MFYMTETGSAVTIKNQDPRHYGLEYEGKVYKSMREFAKEFDLPYQSVLLRYRKGEHDLGYLIKTYSKKQL